MRAMLWMGGVVVILAALIAAGRLPAEDDENKPAPARTRIALFNLTYVIKNYDKYKDFQVEIKEIVEPFQRKDAHLRRQLDKLRAEAEKLSADRSNSGQKAELLEKKRNVLETKAKQVQRQLEDNGMAVKMKLGKRSDEEMKILFRDVDEAVKRYAASHDLDLVLHYNDAVTRDDYLSARNIALKLASTALVPLTFDPTMNISKDISELLNDGLRKTP